MHQGGAPCHSIILAAAHPRGPGLCFHIHVQAAGYLKASFSALNARSQHKAAQKTTLHHKSRFSDKPLSRTRHTSGVICTSDLQACALCIVALNYTQHTDIHIKMRTPRHMQ